MNSYRKIDLETWPRRELFAFYRTFDAPCYNLTVKVEAEPIHTFAKARGESFFLLSLYAILRAANAVPQLRQRIIGGEVIEFEQIAVMTPIMLQHHPLSPFASLYHTSPFPAGQAEKEI